MTATDIISYIEAVPLVLKYIAPGFIFLWIYTRLHDKKLPEHYIMCSVVVSFILVLCVNNVVWDFVIAVVAALIVYVLSRTTWVKNLFKKTISFSPSKTVFYDVIDYENGTYIYVKTDKWIVSGIYIGIDKDAMGVIVKDYKLYNATGDEFDTPECSIATVPLNRIEYTSLTYPEDSKVKKSWFDN